MDKGLAEIVKPWTAVADRLICGHLPRFSSVWSCKKLDEHQMQTLVMLSTACCSASYGQLILIECEKLAEAEILGRTVLEGTLKFVYLISDESEAPSRFLEFTDTLFECAAVKDHFSVKSYFDTVQPTQDELNLPLAGLLMKEDELSEFTQRFSKADRNTIEQRWSVPSLIGALARRERPGSDAYAGLVRNYIMASHVAHADYYGMVAMREREGRSDDRRRALDTAHAARIVSDILSLSTMRLVEALRFSGHGDDIIFPILKEAYDAMQIFEKSYEDWLGLEFGDRARQSSDIV